MNAHNLIYAIMSVLTVFGVWKFNDHQKKLNEQLSCVLDNDKDLYKIKELIMNGANVNASSSYFKSQITPLMVATEAGDLEFMDYLINHGSDINAETTWDQPRAGKPALSFALEAKNLDAAKLLVEAGADVNLYNDLGSSTDLQTIPESLRQRNNPLLTYAIGAKLPMPFIETLLSSKNVDVNKQSLLYPATALMIASAIGYEETVQALLDAGVNKDIVNSLDNKKAIDYARDAGHENIVKLLS